MEEKTINVIVKPEQGEPITILDQSRSGRGRNDSNSNSRSDRVNKRNGHSSFGGNQRGSGGGGYRRGGGSSSHSHKEDTSNRDQTYQFQQRNNQRMQNSEDNAGHIGRNNERVLYDKLKEIGGPTNDLPTTEFVEKKFTGRCRLYLGNIPPNLEENEMKDMLKEYGEIFDVFLNRDKKFSFVRMDYHHNAEKAKNELNGKVIKNYTLKVRFAPHGGTIKVKNLDEHVSNELLHLGFSVFGEIDRAIVSLDDHGKPTGEGIVEFARKHSALLAIRKCTEGCFFLTHTIRPVLVEAYEPCDDQDGYSDRFINKNNPDYQKSRSLGPRLAHTNSFEHEFGMRWKQLYELHKRKQEALKKDLDIEINTLIAQMEYARYEHDTAMLREELRVREMDMDRQKRQWEQKQTQAEEERRKVEDRLRRQQGIMGQVDERDQQEQNLFLQAQQLTNMLECQEKTYYTSGDIKSGQLGDRGDGNSKNDLYSIAKRRRY